MIINADAVQWAKDYDGELFHAFIADPPYHLQSLGKPRPDLQEYDEGKGSPYARQQARSGFMNQVWDGGDIAFQKETWEAFYNILFPGAFGMAFGGSRTSFEMAMAIKEAGFIIHPQIFWSFGSGFPKATRIKIDPNRIVTYNDNIWIKDSRHVKTAKELLLKNLIDHGILTPKNDFALDNVLEFYKENDIPVSVKLVGKSLDECQHLPSEVNTFIVVENADLKMPQVSSSVLFVEKNLNDGGHLSARIIFVRCNATTIACENLVSKIKAEEVQRTENGGQEFWNSEDIDALCVEAKKDLKRIIFNQLKNSQNLDTLYQMENASVMSVIITKSTTEALITSMGDIVKRINDIFGGHRYGLQALKPAAETIIVFQKPYPEKVRPIDSITETGAGALNIDGGRIGTGERFNRPAGNTGDEVVTYAPTGQSAKEKGYDGTTVKGRWPSNFVLTHSCDCEMIGYRESDSYQINRFTDGAKPFGDGAGHPFESEEVKGGRVPVWECVEGCPANSLGDEAKFFHQSHWAIENADPFVYNAKVSVSERNAGLINFDKTDGGIYGFGQDGSLGGHPIPIGRRNSHPTLKPIALIEHLATLLLPPKEYAPRRVFVPFCGVASEVIGCWRAGWEEIIGIELEAEYAEIGRARLEYWKKQGIQLSLFEDAQ